MTANSDPGTPSSPKEHDKEAGEYLEQDMITHQGDYRKPSSGPMARGGKHLGALEDETVPVTPPMTGPLGQDSDDGNGDGVDPNEELTPG